MTIGFPFCVVIPFFFFAHSGQLQKLSVSLWSKNLLDWIFQNMYKRRLVRPFYIDFWKSLCFFLVENRVVQKMQWQKKKAAYSKKKKDIRKTVIIKLQLCQKINVTLSLSKLHGFHWLSKLHKLNTLPWLLKSLQNKSTEIIMWTLHIEQ